LPFEAVAASLQNHYFEIIVKGGGLWLHSGIIASRVILSVRSRTVPKKMAATYFPSEPEPLMPHSAAPVRRPAPIVASITRMEGDNRRPLTACGWRPMTARTCGLIHE
jgi:hypothetical protein